MQNLRASLPERIANSEFVARELEQKKPRLEGNEFHEGLIHAIKDDKFVVEQALVGGCNVIYCFITMSHFIS